MRPQVHTLFVALRRLGLPVEAQGAHRTGQLRILSTAPGDRALGLSLVRTAEGFCLTAQAPYPLVRRARFERAPLRDAKGAHTRIRTGDPRFDGRVFAYGAPDEVRALLSVQVRAWVCALLARRSVRALRFEGNRAHLSLSGLGRGAVIMALLELVQRCARLPVCCFARTLNVALNDPEPQVQTKCVKQLFLMLPGEPKAQQVEALLRIAERAELAPWLRSEALLKLCGLTRRAAAPWARPLGQESDVAELIFRVTGLLFSPPQVALAAADLLVESGCPDAGRRVAPLLESETPEIALGVIPHLERLQDPRCELALLSRLEVGERAQRMAVIEALGRAGTRISLGRLWAISRSPLVPRALRRAARSAIRAIRHRGNAGCLSLARGGELSSAGRGGLALSAGRRPARR